MTFWSIREDGDVVVLSVGRLVPEKGLDVLLRAIAQTGDERLRLVIAGAGPEAARLAELAKDLGVRLEIRGDLSEDALAPEYAAAETGVAQQRQRRGGQRRLVVGRAQEAGLARGDHLVETGQRIVAPDFLRDYRPDVAIAMNPIYRDEIERDLRQMGLETRLLTV